MPRNCTTDAAGCIDCPFIPAVPGTPSHIDTSALVGWNGGANSKDMLADANVYTDFFVPAGVIGVVIGFKETRDELFEPTMLTHAFYFANIAGVDLVSILEFGTTVRAATGRSESDEFEIRRTSGLVEYLINGETVYRSARPSVRPVLVNACLFNTGDGVL